MQARAPSLMKSEERALRGRSRAGLRWPLVACAALLGALGTAGRARAEALACPLPEGDLLTAPAQAPPAVGPRCALQDGDALVDKRQYQRAIDVFACVYRWAPRPYVLALIGQQELELGTLNADLARLRCAEAFLVRALEQHRQTPDPRVEPILQDLRDALPRSRLREGRLVVRAYSVTPGRKPRPADRPVPIEGARLYVRDRAAPVAVLPMRELTLPVGRVEGRVEARDHTTVPFSYLLHPRGPAMGPEELVLELTYRYPLVRQWWFWTGLGVIAGGVVLGAVLGSRERQDPVIDLPLSLRLGTVRDRPCCQL